MPELAALAILAVAIVVVGVVVGMLVAPRVQRWADRQGEESVDQGD